MKTVGIYLKEARLSKKISLEKLESETKIKKIFLLAIEAEDWQKLPAYSVVSGFVRSLAGALDLPVQSALALLRRDYPPRKEKISPSPDVENKVFWSPKLTFVFGVGLLILVMASYLIFQYTKFISPPDLLIYKPKDGEVLISKEILVEGKTDTDSILTVNNQPVILDQEGNFSVKIVVSEETDKIEVKSVSRSGKETVKNVNIKLDL